MTDMGSFDKKLSLFATSKCMVGSVGSYISRGARKYFTARAGSRVVNIAPSWFNKA